MSPTKTDDSQSEPGATMSLADAARQMGVSMKSVRRAAKAGDLPVIRWGGSYRVLRTPFEALIQKGTTVHE